MPSWFRPFAHVGRAQGYGWSTNGTHEVPFPSDVRAAIGSQPYPGVSEVHISDCKVSGDAFAHSVMYKRPL